MVNLRRAWRAKRLVECLEGRGIWLARLESRATGVRGYWSLPNYSRNPAEEKFLGLVALSDLLKVRTRSVLVRMNDTVCVEDVLQGDDAFQLVDVGAIDDREDVEMVCAHAVQGMVERVIRVNVGKIEGIDEVSKFLFAGDGVCFLQVRKIDDADEFGIVGD